MSADETSRVVITGICGHFGRAVARRLHRNHEVIGLDRRPAKQMPKDIDIEHYDIRRRRVEDIFLRQRIDAVVHLNIMHDPRTEQTEHHAFNIVGTQKIFQLCADQNVPKIVVLSSSNVYGPQPTNDQFLTEEAPLMAGQRFEAIRDLIALDMFCNTFFWRHPEIETVILRPANIVGRVNNAPSRYLRLDSPWTIMGFDPMIQLIHVEDVVTALEKTLTPGVRGVFNVAGPSPVPLSLIFEKLGKTPTPVPEPVARQMLKAGWSLKLTHWPVPELDYIKYVCMVDDSMIRDQLGFEHDHSIEDILHDVQLPLL